MKKIYAVIGPFLLLVAWYVAAHFRFVDPFFLPSPLSTVEELGHLLVAGLITADIVATLFRVVAAFLVATVIGVPLGLLLGFSEKVYRSIEFVVDFFRSTPASAVFPLFMIIFGATDTSKIAAAAFAATLVIIFNTAYGVLHGSKVRTLAATLMGASRWQLFWHIVWWETLPHTLIGLRNAVSLSLVVIILTEMFVGTYAGLGRRIVDFQITYNIPAMYATILVVGFTGYIFNMFFLVLEKQAVHWNGK